MNSRTPGASKSRRCERMLWVVVVLLFLACCALAAALVIMHTARRSVCETQDCVKTAATLIASLDFSVDPCEDFYMFACGQWIKNHHIPDDKSFVSNFEQLGEEMNNDLRDLLKQEELDPRDGSAIQKAKKFYQMCENDTLIKVEWTGIFESWLADLGGWPALGRSRTGAPAGNLELESIYALLMLNFEQETLFKFQVSIDDRNSSNYVIQLDKPDLALQLHQYTTAGDPDIHDAYKALIQEVLEQLNVSESRAKAAASEIFDIERTIANLSIPCVDGRKDIRDTYKKFTYHYVKSTLMPKFNWDAFFRNITTVQIRDSTELAVQCVEYAQAFNSVYTRYSRESLTNYLMWHWFFQSFLKELPPPFAHIYSKFQRIQTGTVTNSLKWLHCVKLTNVLLSFATGALFVREHFDPNAKQEAVEMIDNIMDSFREILHEEQWLSHATRKEALLKANAITRKIGYPDFLENNTLTDEYYEKYHVVDNSFYKTKFQWLYLDRMRSLTKLGTAVDKEEWITGPAAVNAFYSPNYNEIIIPSGILQPVFYHKDFPLSLNYGGIGVVIGHEITHGFDDKGRLYNYEGNLLDWWDAETSKLFDERARCIEDQYSNFVLQQVNMTIDGVRTKGENIADNGGLKEAYRAFQKWQQKHGAQPLLPGLNLSHEQLFYVNYAQIWCGKMNDHEAVLKIKGSHHSPGPIRVLGPLSNSYDFAKAYNCKAGSRMHPVEKCKVW